MEWILVIFSILLICIIFNQRMKLMLDFSAMSSRNIVKPETEPKTLVLIRGVSGSGKSTLAETITRGEYPFIEADQYWYDSEGNYNFDYKKLHLAHKDCQERTVKALESGIELVVVSNTSTRTKDVNQYKEFAEEYGYRFTSIVCENRNETKNIHEVPEEALVKMENQLRESIRLR